MLLARWKIATSALGGQVPARRFHEHLGLTPTHGLGYFSGYGADTGRRWGEFCAAAEAAVDRRDHEAAAGAAVATFERLRARLRDRDGESATRTTG